MKSTIAIISTLAFLANAQLSYDSSSKTIKCPVSTGTFCVGTASGLIVTCANGVGTISACATGTTCSQSSPSKGNASCSTTPTYPVSNSTAPSLVDVDSQDCDCDQPHPVISSSAHPPPPSSTPVSPIFSSRYANISSTPVAPVIPSSTPCETTTTPVWSSKYIPPAPPSSTPVGPVIPVVSSSKPVSSHWGTGTGSGYAHPTSRVTTLNSSWKPTLTASSSAKPSSTIASPVVATGGAGKSSVGGALAVGLVGLVAVLA